MKLKKLIHSAKPTVTAIIFTQVVRPSFPHTVAIKAEQNFQWKYCLLLI